MVTLLLLPLVVGRTETALLLLGVLVRTLVLTLDERLPALTEPERLVVVPVLMLVLMLLERDVTLVVAEERFTLLLLLITAALLFGTEATLVRLPVAAALVEVAGRRPCANAPVEVMASPLASIKPIIVL